MEHIGEGNAFACLSINDFLSAPPKKDRQSSTERETMPAIYHVNQIVSFAPLFQSNRIHLGQTLIDTIVVIVCIPIIVRVQSFLGVPWFLLTEFLKAA